MQAGTRVEVRERGNMHAGMTYESIVAASSKQRLSEPGGSFSSLNRRYFASDAVTGVNHCRCFPYAGSICRRCRLIAEEKE